MGLYSEKFTWIRWNYYYFFTMAALESYIASENRRFLPIQQTEKYFYNFHITAKFSLLPIHRFIDECAWKRAANGVRRVMINLNYFTGSIIVSCDWIWFSLMNYKFSFDQFATRWDGFFLQMRDSGSYRSRWYITAVACVTTRAYFRIQFYQLNREICSFDSRPTVNQSLDLHKASKSNSNLFRAVANEYRSGNYLVIALPCINYQSNISLELRSGLSRSFIRAVDDG